MNQKIEDLKGKSIVIIIDEKIHNTNSYMPIINSVFNLHSMVALYNYSYCKDFASRIKLSIIDDHSIEEAIKSSASNSKDDISDIEVYRNLNKTQNECIYIYITTSAFIAEINLDDINYIINLLKPVVYDKINNL